MGEEKGLVVRGGVNCKQFRVNCYDCGSYRTEVDVQGGNFEPGLGKSTPRTNRERWLRTRSVGGVARKVEDPGQKTRRATVQGQNGGPHSQRHEG